METALEKWEREALEYRKILEVAEAESPDDAGYLAYIHKELAHRERCARVLGSKTIKEHQPAPMNVRVPDGT